jgi:SAM-dependent methyltransferase
MALGLCENRFVEVTRQDSLWNYSGLAEMYHRARPTYPVALINLLVDNAGIKSNASIAEIGAGTGHFTRLLADRQFAITALEPVAEMRAQAPALAGVTWTDGTFESTGLPDKSQDWVVSAQAFHWVKAGVVVPEISRILVPGGWFTVLWNAHHIARNPVLQKTYVIIRRNIPDYHYTDRTTVFRRRFSSSLGAAPAVIQSALGHIGRLLGAGNWMGRGLQLMSTGAFTQLVYHEVEHEIPVDRETFLDLWRSRNHLQGIAGATAFRSFMAELTNYLEDQRIDTVNVPYTCGAWSAQKQR